MLFVNSVGTGVDSAVVARRAHFPGLPYPLLFLLALPRIDGFSVKWNDWQGTAVWVLVARGPFIGGGLPIFPDLRPEEPKLGLLIAEWRGRGRLLTAFPALRRGTHGRLPWVHLVERERVVLRFSERRPLSVDGDVLLEGQELEVEPGPRFWIRRAR